MRSQKSNEQSFSCYLFSNNNNNNNFKEKKKDIVVIALQFRRVGLRQRIKLVDLVKLGHVQI